MLKNIIHFLKYNNLTALAVAAVLVGSGGAFAASPELRAAAGEALVGRTETVVAIDNAAILSADFGAFDPALVVTAVKEDAERYSISYRLESFDVEGGAWQKTEKIGELKVAKNVLGDRDLRVYVEEELGEVARQEIRYLKEIQLAERGRGATAQVVAVNYAGLLGLIIDPQEKEITNLDVSRPSAEILPIIDHLVVQPLSEEIISTPSVIEPTTLTESVTTTEPVILVNSLDVSRPSEEMVAPVCRDDCGAGRPAEPLIATTTTPTAPLDIVSTTTSTAETPPDMTSDPQPATNDGASTTPVI